MVERLQSNLPSKRPYVITKSFIDPNGCFIRRQSVATGRLTPITLKIDSNFMSWLTKIAVLQSPVRTELQ